MKKICILYFLIIIMVALSGCSANKDTNVYVSTDPMPEKEELIKIFNDEYGKYEFLEWKNEESTVYRKTIDGVYTTDGYFIERDKLNNIVDIYTFTNTVPQITHESISKLKKVFKGFTELDTAELNARFSEKGKIITQHQENSYRVIDGILLPITLVLTEYEPFWCENSIIKREVVYNRIDDSEISPEKYWGLI